MSEFGKSDALNEAEQTVLYNKKTTAWSSLC